MEDKASSLLPEEFYSKVEHFKSKAGTGDMDMDALSKVDRLTSKYELDYKKVSLCGAAAGISQYGYGISK